MIQTIGTDIQLQATFLATDDRGDVAGQHTIPGQMRALTPLAAMELYEQLHAARNQVRRQAGLPEIATPDEGVLVLAFLRALREQPAILFREVLDRWDEAAKRVQMNRVEEVEEVVLCGGNGHEPAQPWRDGQGPSEKHPWPCPDCHAFSSALPWKAGIGNIAEAICGECGATHTYQEWLHAAGRQAVAAAAMEVT